MTARRAAALKLAFGCAVLVVPPLAYHALVVARGGSALTVGLGWLATLVGVYAIGRVARLPLPALALALAAAAGLWAVTAGTALGIYLMPVATWLALLTLFACTLAPGREPLVAAIARICHGGIDAPIAAYARRVTIAWCVFFASMATTLAAAALVMPLAAWSFLANVAALPLVAVMFAVEYAVRRRRFPDLEHVPPLEMVARLSRAGWSFVAAPAR